MSAVLMFSATLLCTAPSPQAGTVWKSVVGTWRLVSYKSQASDGSVRDLYGPVPLGQLIYDNSGHMSVHLLKPDLPKCETLDRRKCPDQAARVAFDNYFGYWGNYELNAAAKTITHHIEGASVPDWVNTSQMRHFQLAGKRLILTTPIMKVAGTDTVQTLVWERQ
jgi:hypothetical protein